jgi:hypothetical protein
MSNIDEKSRKVLAFPPVTNPASAALLAMVKAKAEASPLFQQPGFFSSICDTPSDENWDKATGFPCKDGLCELDPDFVAKLAAKAKERAQPGNADELGS